MEITPLPTADNFVTRDGVYKSACRMCHGGCGALLHVKDQKISKIEGDPENPMNRGKLCALGAASLEQVLTLDASNIRYAGSENTVEVSGRE